MRYTDYKEVNALARNILKDAKEMISLTEELKGQLKNLEGTFLDDGIEDVKSFVNTLEKALVNSGSAFMTVSGELSAYAALLKQGKR